MNKQYIVFIFLIIILIFILQNKKELFSNIKIKKSNFTDIPIIINNFNQLNNLKKMIDFFSKSKYKYIYILDNDSQYSPLLKYYQEFDGKIFKVIYHKKNLGHLSLWESKLINDYKKNYFVYTDPDLNIKNLPSNFVEDFIKIHKKMIKPKLQNKYKIGCALKIDNLPNHNLEKNNIIKWEKQFWNNRIGTYKNSDVYKSDIDTTLALYPPNYNNHTVKGLRVAGKYTVEHLPWYYDNKKLPDDIKFYLKNKKKDIGHWSSKIQ